MASTPVSSWTKGTQIGDEIISKNGGKFELEHIVETSNFNELTLVEDSPIVSEMNQKSTGIAGGFLIT